MPPKFKYIVLDLDILRRKDLTHKAKMLFGMVKSCGSRGLHIKNDELAELLSCDQTHISRYLKELTLGNDIEIRSPRNQNRYILLSHRRLTRLATSGEPKKIPLSHFGQVASPFSTNETSAYKEVTNTTNTTNKNLSDCASTDPTAPQPQFPKETTMKPQAEKLFETGESPSLKEDFFCRFWETYPRKVNRVKAKKTFDKLNPDNELFGVMMEALGRQKQTGQWLKDDGQFVPHAATWLNGRRWEDEISGPESSGDYTTREISEEEADKLFERKA